MVAAMSIDLTREAYINLATFRRNGVAVETPVWFAPIGDKFYVFTDGTSAKVKRLRASKRIRVAACSALGKPTGPWVDGTGRIVKEPQLVEQAYAALRRKYGWQMTLVDVASRLGGRIGRRAILELSLTAA